MGYIAKISKSGFDVNTTANVNLSFSSDLATHSIFNTPSLGIAIGSASVTYTHNLGYVPKVWIFILLNDGAEYYRRIPLDRSNSGESIDYYITSTTIVIEIEDTTVDYNFLVVIFTRSPNI